MLMTMLLWGINVTSVKVAVQVLPPLGFGLMRYSFAATVLVVVLKRQEGSVGVSRRHLPWLALSGGIGLGLNQVCFLFGIRLISASLAAILLAMAPLMTAAVAALYSREPLTRRAVTAIAVSFGGVALVMAGGSERWSASWQGGLLILGAAATLATGAVLAKQPLRSYSSLRVTTWITLCGGLTLLPLGLPALIGAPWAAVTPTIWLAVSFTLIGATVLGNLAWNFAIKQLGATRTVTYTYLQPVVGIVIAALLLGERLTLPQILGAAIVLLGQALYSFRLRPATSSAEGEVEVQGG